MSAPGTPGPWRWSANPSGGARVDAARIGIADVLSRAGVAHPVQESCIANARLIAAAPDLYEALEALLDHPVDMGANCLGSCRPGINEHEADCPYSLASAALAKARGGK